MYNFKNYLGAKMDNFRRKFAAQRQFFIVFLSFGNISMNILKYNIHNLKVN